MYDMRHGGPYDRGSADAYYGRPRRPHYFKDATYSSEEVLAAHMIQGEIDAYHAGYEGNQTGEKDYGS
jgi:hypothetical protein